MYIPGQKMLGMATVEKCTACLFNGKPAHCFRWELSDLGLNGIVTLYDSIIDAEGQLFDMIRKYGESCGDLRKWKVRNGIDEIAKRINGNEESRTV